MSARDAESGSSTYKGGSRSAGGLGNGGIGGGMGGGGNFGGGRGGGASRNGGIGNRTGLTTGNRMYGGMAVGRPGGPAMNPGAWGIRAAAPIGTGPLSGVRRPGATAVPAAVPGVNPVPETVPNVFNQNYLNSISDFVQSMKNRYGWGANNPNITPGPGPMPAPAPTPGYMPPSGSPYQSYFKNPTSYPQWSGGWGINTQGYTQQNTYPGGTNYTNSTGNLNNTWSNDDTRYGIDSLAQQRGY